MVKWIEEERKIQQFTLKELRVTEEEYYQPQLGKKVNNIVYNYFEGDVLVNKNTDLEASILLSLKMASQYFTT